MVLRPESMNGTSQAIEINGRSAVPTKPTPSERLAAGIEGRRDDLIVLTQALVRMPTVNPPGENYREICEFLKARLSASGFEVELIRARDTPGDSEKYPRWNMVARR